ncbi:hypothetical protein AOA60_00960, partial [Pseudomonas sp. 2822-17]
FFFIRETFKKNFYNSIMIKNKSIFLRYITLWIRHANVIIHRQIFRFFFYLFITYYKLFSSVNHQFLTSTFQ